jgi:hypothetical protein
MYAAAILGLLQIAEFAYNRFAYKLPGQLLALGAIVLTVIWLGKLGVRRVVRKEQ